MIQDQVHQKLIKKLQFLNIIKATCIQWKLLREMVFQKFQTNGRSIRVDESPQGGKWNLL